MKILVTGATGYVGGRLVPELLARGHEVRVLVRDPRRLQGNAWASRVEACAGDLRNPDDASRAVEGVEAAYFLVHAMYEGKDFAETEKQLAENFARAARALPKVIYVGGLLPSSPVASEHLGSRAAVGAILRENGNVTEFRAGPIIGSGSASFEMVRYLTERLPVMITPRWVKNQVQPIAIEDVLRYLVAALDKPPLGVVEIGANRLSFHQMMRQYARARGFRRWIVPVPVLSPRISAFWVGLITPIPNSLAVPLIKGIVASITADTARARSEFPEIEPIAYDQAVDRALRHTREKEVATRWSGALGSFASYELQDREGLLREVRTIVTNASPHALYRSFTGIGGETGWLTWNWTWRLRGFFDKLAGGPGLSRGRRHPEHLRLGEALDFWRVEALEPDRLLRLRAEMKVPGQAWLQFEIIPKGPQSQLVQTAIFAPRGLAGLAYWYASSPAHLVLFKGMARNIARAAEVLDGKRPPEAMPETV